MKYSEKYKSSLSEIENKDFNKHFSMFSSNLYFISFDGDLYSSSSPEFNKLILTLSEISLQIYHLNSLIITCKRKISCHFYHSLFQVMNYHYLLIQYLNLRKLAEKFNPRPSELSRTITWYINKICT